MFFGTNPCTFPSEAKTASEPYRQIARIAMNFHDLKLIVDSKPVTLGGLDNINPYRAADLGSGGRGVGLN
jgi:hypothetical protein